MSGPGRGALGCLAGMISCSYRCGTGTLGRKDPQFANERTEPREVTGLTGLGGAPSLVSTNTKAHRLRTRCFGCREE